MLKLAVSFALAALAAGDCYLHNPRGSNNRLTNQNDNNAVTNANRLFNSQNNNKGGYEVGPTMNNRDMMYYYEGSKLLLEWTNQHECGPTPEDSKSFCDVILQYMCDPTVRDGAVTNTIDTTETAVNDLTRGMHESYKYYEACSLRQRNMGLFLADRDIVDPLGDTAEYTRQNNNQNRRGFECQEERDYYPYWHPTPWRDIAILTNAPSRCPFYQAESQNVKPKNYCAEPNQMYNNAETCPSTTWMSEPAWSTTYPDITAPPCVASIWSRDNHLGNSADGYMANYLWTLPSAASSAGYCVFRIRYNISTADYDGWGTFADKNGLSPVSPVTQDPYVDYGWPGQYLSLALNTDQYGRVFQDRSHSFQIRAKPATPACNTIWNVNVEGKRGTLVQAYPAVQYEFVPNHLDIVAGDCVHFQWTGSNTNSATTQTGRGAERTDRSNICQIASPLDNKCMDLADVTMFSQTDALNFAHLGQAGCDNLDTLVNRNLGDLTAIANDVKNCMILNAASPYFDGGLIQFNNPGEFWYMSTRNNNIGWQSQKASIKVSA